MIVICMQANSRMCARMFKLSQSTSTQTMLILAVSLSHMTEKAAKCALRLRAIALVMAVFLAFRANMVWAFVTAACLVAIIVARRAYRNVIRFIIDIILLINAVIVLIASKLLSKHCIPGFASQHNTLVIIAFVFAFHCDGSKFTSGIRNIVVFIILMPTSV